MRIEHIAIWTQDLQRLRQFYEHYFGATAGEKYHNEWKGFASYFLTFPGDGPRLELMTHTGLRREPGDANDRTGYVHIAISLGTEAAVDALTIRLQKDGYERLDGPRRTGDGYYESVVLDPDGNRIELTV